MNEEDLKEKFEEVYQLGIKHGKIKMKNKILKSINRDWELFHKPSDMDLLVKILNKINKL